MSNEARILANPGEELIVGGKKIVLTDMPWGRANKFEDCLKETIQELLANQSLDLKELQGENQAAITEKLLGLLTTFLQEKPIELLLIAIPEFTEEHYTTNCSKNEVFGLLQLVVENNYATVKNFLSLISKVMN